MAGNFNQYNYNVSNNHHLNNAVGPDYSFNHSQQYFDTNIGPVQEPTSNGGQSYVGPQYRYGSEHPEPNPIHYKHVNNSFKNKQYNINGINIMNHPPPISNVSNYQNFSSIPYMVPPVSMNNISANLLEEYNETFPNDLRFTSPPVNLRREPTNMDTLHPSQQNSNLDVANGLGGLNILKLVNKPTLPIQSSTYEDRVSEFIKSNSRFRNTVNTSTTSQNTNRTNMDNSESRYETPRTSRPTLESRNSRFRNTVNASTTSQNTNRTINMGNSESRYETPGTFRPTLESGNSRFRNTVNTSTTPQNTNRTINMGISESRYETPGTSRPTFESIISRFRNTVNASTTSQNTNTTINMSNSESRYETPGTFRPTLEKVSSSKSDVETRKLITEEEILTPITIKQERPDSLSPERVHTCSRENLTSWIPDISIIKSEPDSGSSCSKQFKMSDLISEEEKERIWNAFNNDTPENVSELNRILQNDCVNLNNHILQNDCVNPDNHILQNDFVNPNNHILQNDCVNPNDHILQNDFVNPNNHILQNDCVHPNNHILQNDCVNPGNELNAFSTTLLDSDNNFSSDYDTSVNPRNEINSNSTNTLESVNINNVSSSENVLPINDSNYVNRSPSPERKYLHLIRMSATSPERKFLERLQNRSITERRKFRSRSRSVSPLRRSDRSQSPRRYKSSMSSNQRYSRSSNGSSNYSRSRNPSLNKNKVNFRGSSMGSASSSHKSFDRTDHQKSSSNELSNESEQYTERESLLLKYRKDYCSDINEMRHKMNELSKLNIDEIIRQETRIWTRMSPANLYYVQCETPNILKGTEKLNNLCKEFEELLIRRSERARAAKPNYEPPLRKKKTKFSKHKSEACSSNSDSESDTSSEEEDCTMEELERKRNHPYRLHPELWFNDAGEMNDGPLCRCSAKARRSGIRHNIYAGESNLPRCDLNLNNANKLHHYRITISPPTNFLIKTPTIISHDDHEFIFEGFSMFSHIKLDKLPVCKVIRFNIEYTILYFEEKMPENFTIKELDLFYEYLFKEILELVDLDLKAAGDTSRCDQFHFMPRFVRELPENGKEILSMNEVLSFLLKSSDDLVDTVELGSIQCMPQYEWQKKVDSIKGMVVTLPGMKPCALRVDQLDRDEIDSKVSLYPEIVHFGIRPPQLSYAGNPEYQKAWREYVKFRHLLANMPKPSFDDKRKLELKEIKLQEMRTQTKMKRDVTVTVNSQGFKKTGIMCDIVQHAMLIPVLVSHLRFHCSLGVLEESINYKFENRYLLQLALTHPSYRENFGTNPDHARNSLTNCGIRQPEYGDRRIHYMNTRKRGINTLINIMSRFGKRIETESNITHNERLEFLGDAVVEFITSIHLFHMFPELEEGGLATYRAAIVQNQHLAVLAKTLKLDEFMLYAHGSDLCHDLELRHAMANCFEALMGALFLDGGIKVADKAFGETLFKTESDLLDVWVNYPPHPLQEQEPLGDRKWIPRFELLKKLTDFEESIGIEFTHMRLLARAFTDRSIGYTNLTLGSNQRLEFLGDTVLQLIASEYLYKYFPEHHEGHLSLLRSSLVNNRTQAVVCNDLGMTKYALYHNPKAELKTKDRADLLEAFLGALYVDKGLEYCEAFCNVCFFPRLQMFIMRQDWNDPKSKLQQCCLTLRTMEGGEPEIPIYKVIECMGPTNTRIYTVAVYFKGQRLAEASGHSIQQAEMNAAKKALQRSHGLFPQLDHQKRVIAKSLKTQHGLRPNHQSNRPGNNSKLPYNRRFRKDFNFPTKRSNNDNFSNDRSPKRFTSSSSSSLSVSSYPGAV